MNTSAPKILSTPSWLALLVQVLIIFLFNFIFTKLGFADPIIFAAVSYAVVAQVLRWSIAKYHRQGLKLAMQKRYEESIPFFEKSFAFFTKHEWVDKYRSLTLLSSTGTSYAQMALNNIAFAYTQSGNAVKAIEFYKLSLERDKNDSLAQAGLNMLQAAAPAANS